MPIAESRPPWLCHYRISQICCIFINLLLCTTGVQAPPLPERGIPIRAFASVLVETCRRHAEVVAARAGVAKARAPVGGITCPSDRAPGRGWAHGQRGTDRHGQELCAHLIPGHGCRHAMPGTGLCFDQACLHLLPRGIGSEALACGGCGRYNNAISAIASKRALMRASNVTRLARRAGSSAITITPSKNVSIGACSCARRTSAPV